MAGGAWRASLGQERKDGRRRDEHTANDYEWERRATPVGEQPRLGEARPVFTGKLDDPPAPAQPYPTEEATKATTTAPAGAPMPRSGLPPW